MNVNLNTRCRIEYPVVGKDPVYGSTVTTWSLKAVLWCNVQDVLPSKTEEIKSNLKVNAKRARLRIRYRKDLDSSMRVIIDGATYQLISDFAELGNKQYAEAMIEKYSS